MTIKNKTDNLNELSAEIITKLKVESQELEDCCAFKAYEKKVIESIS